MGSSSNSTWFDQTGEAAFWKNVPLWTIKKAFFKKGNTVRTLLRLALNSVVYDFNKTAQGGAVIVPPDYSVIEFISPDGRIDYKTLLGGNLGEALTSAIAAIEAEPIAAWDKFAEWFVGTGIMGSLTSAIAKCELCAIGSSTSVVVNIPNFAEVTNMASLLEATKEAVTPAHAHALSTYQVDTAAFGWALKLTSVEDESGGTFSLTVGFLFRE